MITSIEPGYYPAGEYGIRIENLYVTVMATDFERTPLRKFCKFESLTMCPISRRLIDVRLLTDAELDWVNSYHATVRTRLLPIMETVFPEAIPFLMRETEPLSR